MLVVLTTLRDGTAVAWPLVTIALACFLVVLSVINIRTYRLPDVLTLPMISAGIFLHASAGGVGAAANSLAGAVVGYAIIWGLASYWRARFKQDGIGMGDAKLLAAGGAWCGPFLLPVILLLSSGLGLVFAAGIWLFGKPSDRNIRTTRIPFGPFLSVGIFSAWWLVPSFA